MTIQQVPGMRASPGLSSSIRHRISHTCMSMRHKLLGFQHARDLKNSFDRNPRGSPPNFIVLKRSQVTVSAQGDGITNMATAMELNTILLVIAGDNNPALSSDSRATLGTAASLAMNGKLSIIFIDQKKEGENGTSTLNQRAKLLQDNLQALGMGLDQINVLEEEVEASVGKGSVAVGDAADSLAADLVLVSSSAIHEHQIVDANLLAEFVPCPLLVLP